MHIRYPLTTAADQFTIPLRIVARAGQRLLRIQERAPLLFIRFATIVAQPGLSIAASTDEQMRLLAGAESYVRAVTKGTFAVYCST